MPRAVLAALFPPASAVEHAQHGNMTSQCITRVTGNTAWDWVDLFTYSPDGRANELDQDRMNRFIKAATPAAIG